MYYNVQYGIPSGLPVRLLFASKWRLLFILREKDFGNYYKNPARFGSQRLKKINECTSGAKVFSGSRKGYVLIPIILTPSTKNSRQKTPNIYC